MNQEGQTVDMWRDVPTLLAAAHELKSPLVLIRQLALQLEDEGGTVVAERIRLTAERSLQLVEGLTRVARLEDSLFDCEPINLSTLFDEVAHEISPLASALRQEIQVAVTGRMINVLSNRSLLRSVLLGLCDNALTHNNPEQAIILSARRSHDRVISSVRDFGPATSHLREVRRRIGRSPQPLSSRPRSSGLGLLIAEQFARHMDADLSLCRHRADGVTFSVSLPASQQLSLLTI